MLRPIEDMKTYQAMVNNAKKIEMICNSFGEANQLKNTIELVGSKEMVLIAECFIRQIYRESGEDFNGYYGVSVMMDDRNAASFDFAKQLMMETQFKRTIERETEFFEPLGAEDLRFNYIERIYNRLLINYIERIYNRLLIKSKEDDSRIGNSEVEAAVVALYFTRTHKTLQQNLFRICCNLLREKGYIDSTTKIYLPYI